jgi:excisionase family DNA binding protein
MARPLHDDPLMTAQEFATESHLSLRKVRGLIADGELEIVQVGRAVRIRRSVYAAFLRRYQRRRSPRRKKTGPPDPLAGSSQTGDEQHSQPATGAVTADDASLDKDDNKK